MAKFCERKDETGDHNETKMMAMVNVVSTFESQKVKWILDSGSTTHMSKKRKEFIIFTENDGHVKVGNTNVIESIELGMIRICSMDNRQIHTINFHNEIYAP